MCCLAWGGKVANSWKHPCFWAVNLGCRFLFYRGKQVMVGCLLMARLFPLDFFFCQAEFQKKKAVSNCGFYLTVILKILPPSQKGWNSYISRLDFQRCEITHVPLLSP